MVRQAKGSFRRAGRAVPVSQSLALAVRESKERREMPRRKLTLEQQLKGIRAAIRSERTPPQLREGLERRKTALERLLKKTERDEKARRTPSAQLFTL